ncbi:MAG: glycosyltransferase family 2 protein [Planctomycetaceae bacterium]
MPSQVKLTHVSERRLLSELRFADQSEVWVIIPAHNEARSLPLVLGDLPNVGRVIVVDNASTDATAVVASQSGADVVQEERRGYGSACLAGIARIRALVDSGHDAPEVIVFLDGDYSDYPEELPRLVRPILQGTADFVLGSRLQGCREPGAMPPQSIHGNRLACWLMRVFWGARYTDLGPFRAISWKALDRLGMQDTNFGWTVEMQIKATLAGLRTQEFPVRYRRRVGVSKISGTFTGTIKAGAKILYTIGKYGWQTRCVRPPNHREDRI